MSLRLIPRAPGASPLVRGYLDADDAVTRYFGRHFRRLSDFEAKVDEVDSRFDAERRRLALATLQIPDSVSDDRKRTWVEQGGLAVTTGQQPGLFGGPLYGVYKALGALRLAAELESRLDRPVLPIFWVASEDHDWAEADHTYVLDAENVLHRLHVADPGHGDRALHRIELHEELLDAIDTMLEILPTSDFSSRYFELIRHAYVPGSTLADGFTHVMRELLMPLGVCFADAAEPALKAASQEVLFSELERSEAHERVLSKRASELDATGYGVQVPILAGGVNLFMEGPGGRERLYRTEDALELHRSGTTVTASEIEAGFESDPRMLSPNVLLRPVVESHVLPTLSYVAGPGEMAYFAQLPPLFEGHGIEMPIVMPRPAFTIVETKIGKVLDKFEMDVDALDRPFHEIASDIARDEVPADVKRALGELRGAAAQLSGKLQKAATAIDPTLKGPIQHLRNTTLYEIAEVEKKIVQSLKRENEIALSQLEKAQIHLFPEGKPQERMLNPFYYLARYGNSFLEALVDAIEVDLTDSSA